MAPSPARKATPARAPKQRKESAGLAHRDDIRTFVDFIDADGERL
jgi:hypothetical protein